MDLLKFDPVGPFDLVRADQIVAANYLGFVLSRGWSRVLSYTVVIISVFGVTVGILARDTELIVLGLLLPLLICLVFPASRTNRRNRNIVVSDVAEGLQIETDQVRAIYRWDRIGPSRVFAERLFVMIDPSCGLVIPKRATTAANFAILAARCGSSAN